MRPCRSLLRGARGPPASRPAPPGPCTRPGLPACLRAALLAHERAAACPGRRKPQHFHAPQHHTGPVALNRPRQGSEQRKRSASRRCRGSGARQPGAAAERGSPARSEPHRVGAAGQAQRLGEREEDAAGARGDRRDRRRQQRLRKHERVGQAERRLAERADDAVRNPAAQARLDEAARQPERDRDQPPARARAAPLSPAPLPPGFASGCGAGRGAAARAVPVANPPGSMRRTAAWYTCHRTPGSAQCRPAKSGQPCRPDAVRLPQRGATATTTGVTRSGEQAALVQLLRCTVRGQERPQRSRLARISESPAECGGARWIVSHWRSGARDHKVQGSRVHARRLAAQRPATGAARRCQRATCAGGKRQARFADRG